MARRTSSPRRTRRALATRSDATLVQSCLAGSEAAWDELVERYGRLVYSIARRYGFSEADADDLFQNVFAILHRKLDSVRDYDRLSAWLIRTTHRECFRIGRRSGRHAELDQSIVDPGAPAGEQAVAWERQHLVRQALARLGGQCEQLLTALFLASGQPSYQAIAERLGMKVGSIGPTRARCFEKLEKILKEMGLRPGSEDPPPPAR
ncbi:MAG: RNA polymerase sigma factor [Planctomycetota bacterium]